MKLLFAQGNPDQKYTQTRHNTGFFIVDLFGEAHSATWKTVDKFKASIAELTINGEKVLLVKPLSFYNDTGLVARMLTDFYKLDPSQDLLVIHDDLALPLGTLRVRNKGSDAGNNGIKSLNAHLGDAYYRLRIGIWTEDRDRMNDINFVLGKFTHTETKKLEELYPEIASLINLFLKNELASHSITV